MLSCINDCVGVWGMGSDDYLVLYNTTACCPESYVLFYVRVPKYLAYIDGNQQAESFQCAALPERPSRKANGGNPPHGCSGWAGRAMQGASRIGHGSMP